MITRNNFQRYQTCRGTFLLICMALLSAMTAITYAYVLSMRIANDAGPSLTVNHLVHQTAKAGATHAAEMLIRDYLDRPLVPTSAVGPHRIFFDPIDNYAAGNLLRDSLTSGANASGTPTATLWNDNDLQPAAKLLNPYRPFRAHEGRQYDYASDNHWLSAFTSPAIPRYIESMSWSMNFLREVGTPPGKIDVTVVPAVAPEVNTPIYYDARWRPVSARVQARYRLRYTVMCEDLSGHLLSGLQASFDRGDPLAIDGDLVATGKSGRGTEFDHAWALKYSPAVCNMLPTQSKVTYDGYLSNAKGSLLFNLPWLGMGGGSSIAEFQNGFTSTGTLVCNPWAWRNSFSYISMNPTRKGLPQMPPQSGTWNRCIPHHAYSWQGLRGYFGDSFAQGDTEFALAGLLTPYGSPTRWDANPDPEAPDATLANYAYNEGPTDSPWRINPLTAPANALSALFSGFRAPPMWEQLYTRKFVVPASGSSWAYPTTQAGWLAILQVLPTPKSSQHGFPNPFRSTFTTKQRATGTALRPFAQFIVSPSADNPRSRTDPCYPSPVSGLVGDQLGRFSDLYLYQNGDRFFGSARHRAIGTCWAHPDTGVRGTMRGHIGIFPSSEPNEPEYGSSTYRPVPGSGDPLEIYIGATLPWESPPNRPKWDQCQAESMAASSYWLDALVAMNASVSVAAAAYQMSTVYPIAPPSGGDTALFAGKWGNSTLDRDTDGDGFNETASAFTNVGDLDRLFLSILGEDPDNPGNNLFTREAIYPVQRGTGTDYNQNPFRPILSTLPMYNPSIVNYGSMFETSPWGAQCPYINTDNARLINLRRSSLLNIRRNLYLNEPSFQSEAVSLVRGTPPYSDDKTQQKAKQLMRCRLRDAERVINDIRMSFLGSNLRYRDRTRNGHVSQGRFRPYDLDGDGWAICSAYVPSDLASLQAIPYTDASGSVASYRFAEPADWSTVVFDEQPDNPGRIDTTTLISSISDPVWVCFRDIDPAIVTLHTGAATSDFLDEITYTLDDGNFPGGTRARTGYTRWFYPAVRVLDATDAVDGPIIDGVAATAPDTYFSISGYFVLEKSRFYRMISRGEVWDEMKKAIVNFAILESVFMLDPDGDVLITSPSKPIAIDPASGKVLDATGIEDTGFIYQRWLKDFYGGSKDRAGNTK
jgi:hypothetical protein